MNKKDKIFIAGHKGLVGSAILRTLKKQGYTNLITREKSELNLINQNDVEEFFLQERPKYVFLAAAKVGGIYANSRDRSDFIYENLAIQLNVIHAAYKFNIERLLFLGSSCIYPRDCPQPIKEEYLLTGVLEKTNESYAIAKIAGLKLCEAFNFQYGTNFISVMPTNLYGLNDNFDLKTSHVLPALIRKAHEAKIKKSENIVVWGSGKVRRDFLYVDDMASACVLVMNEKFSKEVINIGSGQDILISDLVLNICKIVGYHGRIIFDKSMPDGTPQKILDITNISNLGWKPRTSLEEGIQKTYNWYLNNITSSQMNFSVNLKQNLNKLTVKQAV